MPFQNIDNARDPQTDEFEKLEFLPEKPASDTSVFEDTSDDTSEIVFDPEPAQAEEPPVSFDLDRSPESSDDLETASFGLPAGNLDLDVDTPFELFGTSLFDEREFDADDLDFEDDLEF